MAAYLLPVITVSDPDILASEFIQQQVGAISASSALTDPLTAAPWLIAGAACLTLAVVVAENAANLRRCRVVYSEWREHTRQRRWHLELVEGMRLEAREAWEGLADLAGLSRLPNLPCLPTLPDFPALPDLPALQGLRQLPMLRRLSHLPDLPTLPTLPTLPRLAGLANLADLVRLPDLLALLENIPNEMEDDQDNELLVNSWVNDEDIGLLMTNWAADIERAAATQSQWLAEAALTA
ncbi:hypothetical protein BDF19DRAFT_451247 [Syncephalis fuscata]|nr:hypothetical protein BDF19DRAFT_451247 [Syncephalis fuscata]